MNSKSSPPGKLPRCGRHPLDAQIQKILDDKFPVYVLYAVGFAIVVLMELQKLPQAPWGYTYCAAFFVAVALFQFHRVRRQVHELKLGRDGERLVAEQLEVLQRQGARVLHDIRGDNFTLNHVVVCAKGIFVVETKTLSRPQSKTKVVFDGERLTAAGHPLDRDAVEQSSAHVAWLSRLLKHSTGQEFPVRGVLALPGLEAETTASGRYSRLSVLEPEELPSWFSHEPKRLKDYEVAMAGFHLEQYARAGAQ